MENKYNNSIKNKVSIHFSLYILAEDIIQYMYTNKQLQVHNFLGGTFDFKFRSVVHEHWKQN